MTVPVPPNPLFEPWSEYGRLRRPMVPLEKLRGYVLELAARRRRGRADPEPPPPSARRLALGYAGTAACLVLDRNGHLVPAAQLGGGLFYEPKKEVQQFVSQLLGMPSSDSDTDCRLFVLDPVVVERLETLAGGDLAAAFAATRIAASLELARLLSAVPDVDGRIAVDGRLVMDPVELPAECFGVRSLPSETVLVLVVDTEGGGRL